MSNKVTVARNPLRPINEQIRALVAAGESVSALEPVSRHNLGVGLTGDGHLTFDGPVGYFCGGLLSGPTVEVNGNAGWAVAESMASGSVTVNGDVGMGAGASMRGGFLHIRGNAGPRCGISQKGGLIIVEGNIGFASGFMAHKGRLLCLGDAGDAIGDSLWGGEVWVGGEVASLGTDTKLADPDAEEVADVESQLAPHGLGDTSRNWKKVVSAQQLWHFKSRDAASWLMI